MKIIIFSKTVIEADTTRELFRVATEAIEELERTGQDHGTSQSVIVSEGTSLSEVDFEV